MKERGVSRIHDLDQRVAVIAVRIEAHVQDADVQAEVALLRQLDLRHRVCRTSREIAQLRAHYFDQERIRRGDIAVPRHASHFRRGP